MRIHELQHFALGDHVGGVRHDLHDALRADGRHHLERARVDEVAHQHARLVAEDVVSRGAAAALLRAIDHVVVQQRRGVNELDEGGRFDVFVGFDAAGATREHAEQGAQAFAAAADDVFGNLVDERHGALQAGADHGVHGGKIGANQGANILERHGLGGLGTGRGARGGQRM